MRVSASQPIWRVFNAEVFFPVTFIACGSEAKLTIRLNVRDCLESVKTVYTKALLNDPFPIAQFRPENVAFSLFSKVNKRSSSENDVM